MRILFLSSWYPYPPNNGIKLRNYNLLQGLAKHHEVSLISFTDRQDVDSKDATIRSFCRDVHVVPWEAYEPRNQQSILGLFSNTPRSIIDTYSIDMENCINEALSWQNFDLIIASEITTASYAHWFQKNPSLFEDPELGVIYDQYANADSSLYRLRNGLTWIKQRFYLKRLLSHFQACTVVSEREKQLLRMAVPEYQTIEVIPNCINLSHYSGFSDRVSPDTLIFTGSFKYRVNYDAMVWFLQKVFPSIQTEIPDVSLTITGDHANLPLPESKNLTLTGFVDDVRPMIQSSWISLAPIWQGSGTRLKILESMALCTPVVATSKGAEGLDVQDGVHLLIADSPEAFAHNVIGLLREPDLRKRLTSNAYQLVQEKYDWASVMPNFLNVVDQVANL